MYEQNMITQEEWDEALADNVYDRIQNVNISVVEESSTPYSYFVDELIPRVISDLQTKLGYSEEQARKLLYSGGLKIYTTQDSSVQAIVDAAVNNPENYTNTKGELLDALSFTYQMTVTHADGTTTNYSEGHIKQYYHTEKGMPAFQLTFSTEEEILACIDEFEAYILETGEEGDTIWGHSYDITLQPQTSMVVMEQNTGYVAAITGGRGEKTTSLSLNRATQSTRQPGSTFKVLAAFAPALDACGSTLATTYYDEPYDYFGSTVNNWWGSYYGGYGSIREAIIYSSNILATRCLVETVTPTLAMSYLTSFGFTTLDPVNDLGYSLALGGITNGVTNLELTAAYAAIANGGVYTEPIFYTKILDNNGKVLINNEPETHRVIRETTAWLLADAMREETAVWMQNYTGESGEKTVASSGLDMNFGDMYVAGKSGTTTSTKDIWFTGFTPYYTATIWCGYDDSSSMESLSTGSFHRKIWKEVMEQINAGKENIGYPMPSGIVEAEVCSISGKLAVEGVCENDPEGTAIVTEYFTTGTVPTEYCDKHLAVSVCSASGQAAGSQCPLDSTYTRVFRVLPDTATTADSYYALPQDILSGNVCYIHSGGSYPEGENLWWAGYQPSAASPATANPATPNGEMAD
jgi:penicillin-binding protein 1A